MEFEWDEAKAKLNHTKHGVSFGDDRFVFKDENAFEEIDDSVFYGEERWKRTGWIENKIITVVYTTRQSNIRIISARRVTKNEQQDYYL